MQSRQTRDCKRNRLSAVWYAILLALWSLPSRAFAQPDQPFFDGKTIQLLVASGPGATTDISARLVARYLGKHIPGNPGIVVRNMSGGGGLITANYLFNVAKPDGLTIAAMNRANYVEQMVGRPEVKADFRKFSWIGSFEEKTGQASLMSSYHEPDYSETPWHFEK